MRNSNSFDEFYASRASRLVRNIYLRTGDLGRAEDCVQEAFTRAWRRWPRLEGDDPVGWVTTVAWRLAIREWHRTTRSARAMLRLGAADVVDAPPDELIHLRDALKQLPSGQSEVLVLHYLEDLPVRDIARILEMPEGTVKSHLSRGRVALKTIFETGGSRR